MVALSYVGFVLIGDGQAMENAALRGADQVDTSRADEASKALNTITVASLLAACGIVGAVGLLRRSVAIALAAVGTIVMGQVLTQSLKRVILPRPGLVDVSPAFAGNSFPSGHTAIALSVLAATFIVTSHRWRGVVVFLLLSWAASIGAYTLTAKWHRLSDTLGAAGVTLVVAAVATLWLHSRGLVFHVEGPPRRLRVVFVGLLALGVFVSVALGLAVLFLTGQPLGGDAVDDYNIYAAFQSLAGAGSTATALALWWGWHRLEVVSPAEAARRNEATT